MVRRIMIMLELFVAFCEVKGWNPSDKTCDKTVELALKELRKEGITNTDRINKIMLMVSERI